MICIVWHVNIVMMVEKKNFEIAAMIEKDTQMFGAGRDTAKYVPVGPALRGANGQEHVKPEVGWFPKRYFRQDLDETLNLCN